MLRGSARINRIMPSNSMPSVLRDVTSCTSRPHREPGRIDLSLSRHSNKPARVTCWWFGVLAGWRGRSGTSSTSSMI